MGVMPQITVCLGYCLLSCTLRSCQSTRLEISSTPVADLYAIAELKLRALK